jgi:hypothetical protein
MITLNSSTTLKTTSSEECTKLNRGHRKYEIGHRCKKPPVGGIGRSSRNSSKLKNQLLGTATDRLSVDKVRVAITTPVRNRTVHLTTVREPATTRATVNGITRARRVLAEAPNQRRRERRSMA